MIERRKTTRWSANRQIRVKLEGFKDFVYASLIDINFKGLQICLRHKLDRDAVVKFTAVLSEEFTLDAEAWISWHRGVDGFNIYGLYFTKIKDSDKEQIYKFVHKHLTHEVAKKWWKGTGCRKGGETMEDRRIFERFGVDFPVKLLDLASGREANAQACDVSAKGVGFTGKTQWPQGTPVEMWLEIPDKGEPFYTRGKIAWAVKSSPAVCRGGVNLESADLMGLSRVLRVK